MKELRLPSSYAALPEEEQRLVTGGGELGDALGNFFDHLHLDDLFLGGGLISFSFTFVPMLLFNVVKTGVSVGFQIYNKISDFFGFSNDTVDEIQSYANY